MKINDLAHLTDDTDWALIPVIILLIILVVSGIGKSINSPTQQINTQSVVLATSINDSDFNKAMPHILKREGTCSNHWADNGGKTFMGITREVAKKHGHSDPCKMTKEQVYQVYYKDYWSRVPQNIEFNKKLIHFNLIINGTKQHCLNKPDPLSMLDCQDQHYRNQTADFKEFGDGWLNRNNYFKKIIGKN